MTINKLDGNILIVDDSTDTLKFLAEVIEPSGKYFNCNDWRKSLGSR